MVSNIAKISAMGAIAAYTGHRLRANAPTEEPYIDGSNDPTNNLWGKTRVGNDVYDPTGGDASTLRMFARLGTSAYMYGREAITGKEGTAPSAGETFKWWLNSRETVLLGLGKTLLTGKDWLGKPIDRTDALLKAFPIEFVISVVEAGTADGTWEQLVVIFLLLHLVYLVGVRGVIQSKQLILVIGSRTSLHRKNMIKIGMI
jgi:hypothetical protein